MSLLALTALLSAALPDEAALRLGAEALMSARVPSGLVVLEATGDGRRWLTAEVQLFAGATARSPGADALVAALRLRDPERRGEARLGRMIVHAGGLRPLHVDGLSGVLRARTGTSLEAFAGVPVAARAGERDHDRVLGARVAQRFGRVATAGVAYLMERDAGRLADSELALDLALSPWSWLDAGLRGAYDLANPGLAELVITACARRGTLRLEVFGTHRSPARLLPSTSLFSVLGDVASRHLGAEVRWRPAPRLDLVASGGARSFEDALGEEVVLRAALRLDDQGLGLVALEGRRQGLPEGGWSGARLVVRAPLAHRLTASAELELVRPDAPGARGPLWPWGLTSVTWRAGGGWDLAVALQAAASPRHAHALDGLLRVSHRWSGP